MGKVKLYFGYFKSYLIISTKAVLEFIFVLILKLRSGKKIELNNNSIKSICIPIMYGIGDAIILTPYLNELRNIYPKSSISIIANKRIGDLLKVTFPDFKWIPFQSWFGLFPYIRTFDLLIGVSRNMNTYLLALLLWPKLYVGYNYTLRIQKGESHFQRAQRLFQILEMDTKQKPYMFITKKIINGTHKLIRSQLNDDHNKIVSLIVGGRWSSKIYPSKQYRILINHFLKYKNIVILLIGDNFKEGDCIKQGFNNVVNFSGTTTLQEVIGIIYHSDLVIGPDGGLLHIAMALQNPVIGLFGSVAPESVVSKPYLNHMVYQKNCPLQPCYNEEHKPFCPFDSPTCIEIDTNLIINKIQEKYPDIMN